MLLTTAVSAWCFVLAEEASGASGASFLRSKRNQLWAWSKLVCAQSKLGSLSFLNHIDRDTPDGVAQLPLGLIISAVTPPAACVPLAHAAGGVTVRALRRFWA